MLAKKTKRRNRIRTGIRTTVQGTAVRPRLAVFRSNRDIYAQVIDDDAGHTLLSASSKENQVASMKGSKTEQAKAVGITLAKKAGAKGIKEVLFDRGGFLYHGRVKALAEGAREGGLSF